MIANTNSDKDTPPIMTEIRDRIQQHRQARKQDKPGSLIFPDIVCPGKPADIPYDAYLYRHLQQANELYAENGRRLVLTDSRLDRVPVIGRFWQAARRQLHAISMFYDNRALIHQHRINRHLVEAITRLTAETQRQQRTINQLQAQLDAQPQHK